MTKVQEHALKFIKGTRLGYALDSKKLSADYLKILDVIASLLVLIKTEDIRTFLERTDPKALEQAERSLT